MRLNEKYSITHPDIYNYCLVEHKVRGKDSKNTGEEYLDILGYFGTFEGACLKALQKRIDTKDMKTILASITKARNDIVRAIKKNGNTLKVEE